MEGGVDEAVKGVGDEMNSCLAPQPDSDSQFRIASGSHPRRCEAKVNRAEDQMQVNSYNEINHLNISIPLGHFRAIRVEENRYMSELGVRKLEASIEVKMKRQRWKPFLRKTISGVKIQRRWTVTSPRKTCVIPIS